MAKFKLTAGPNLPAGAFVNLAAADVMTADGQATRCAKGDVIDVTEIRQRERLEHAVSEGHLIIEEVEE